MICGASLLLLFLGVALLALFTIGCQAGSLAPAAEYDARYRELPNFREGRFVNPEDAAASLPGKSDFANTVAWLFGGSRPDFTLPEVKLQKSSFTDTSPELRFYWLGHSSVIIEIEGIRILTDPVFGSPGPFPGLLRRFQPPPLAREELPPLDLVLITHDHYDHLEKSTIEFLKAGTVHFVVPAGVGDRLRGWGIQPERIHELHWDQLFSYGDLRITAVTARHFSGRGLADRDRTLWTSYVLTGKEHRVFLGGDGGYGNHFKAIGERHGPFDVALIEIGAWDKGWPEVHLFPEETIAAHLDLRGDLLLPIHYAAFDLALHAWDEPIKRALSAAEEKKVRLYLPRMGEAVTPLDTPPQEEWWIRR